MSFAAGLTQARLTVVDGRELSSQSFRMPELTDIIICQRGLADGVERTLEGQSVRVVATAEEGLAATDRGTGRQLMIDDSVSTGSASDKDASSKSRQEVSWLRWPSTWAYAVLSGLDIFLTYRLLVTQQHVEANPIARYFIDGWGLKGMVWFKLGMTVFVLAVIHSLFQKKEAYSRGVVRLGVVVVGCVDVYSLWLLTAR